jgi:predicted DNA binding CopG/RHH family protein
MLIVQDGDSWGLQEFGKPIGVNMMNGKSAAYFSKKWQMLQKYEETKEKGHTTLTAIIEITTTTTKIGTRIPTSTLTAITTKTSTKPISVTTTPTIS